MEDINQSSTIGEILAEFGDSSDEEEEIDSIKEMKPIDNFLIDFSPHNYIQKIKKLQQKSLEKNAEQSKYEKKRKDKFTEFDLAHFVVELTD